MKYNDVICGFLYSLVDFLKRVQEIFFCSIESEKMRFELRDFVRLAILSSAKIVLRSVFIWFKVLRSFGTVRTSVIEKIKFEKFEY